MLTVHTRTGWSNEYTVLYKDQSAVHTHGHGWSIQVLCFTKISQQYTHTDMGGVYCALQRLVSSTQYSK